ncbi:endonuclease III [Corynebacterium confusum]
MRDHKPSKSAKNLCKSDPQRTETINKILSREYPDARCELDFRNPLELLVATVLSAQCTDARVNQVTPSLFAKYPNAAAYAQADPAQLEEILRPLGFQRAKTKHLLGIGEGLLAHFGGEVPRGIKELTSLPGVGRKTALVVRGNAFGLPGLTVDTHFQRLVTRLGLTEKTTPVAIEKDIAGQLPEGEWTMFSHRLIFHGRAVCRARGPRCGDCVLAHLCPAAAEYGKSAPAQ